MKSERGFTLVELMIAIAVTMLLLVALYGAVNSVQRSSTGIERRIEAQQAVKPALDLMALEISMASYNPNYTTGMWVNPDTCGAASNQNYRGIQEADLSAITLQMDIDKDSAVSAANEIIRYQYLSGASDRRITRETIRCGSGGRTTSGAQPLLGGNPNTGIPCTVRVINDTLNIPLFRYYDGAGAEITGANLPARIPDIRRIEITLAVETQEADRATGQRRQLIYSTSVIPRNHAIIP